MNYDYTSMMQAVSDAHRVLDACKAQDRPPTGAEIDIVARGLASKDRLQALRDIKAQAAAMVESGEIETKAWPTSKEASLTIAGGGSQFKDWASYLQAVANTRTGYFDQRLRLFDDLGYGLQSKAMSESTGAAGGFLVPDQFRQEVLSAVYDQGAIASKCRHLPMSTRQLTVPSLDQTGTTSGADHWHGNMTLYWTEEASGPTEDNPDIREIQLVAHKLMGYTRASDEVMADSQVLGSFLPANFRAGIQWMVERAIVRGTGAGQPLGIISAGATITHARETQSGITLNDLLQMREYLLPSSQSAVWLVHPSCLKEFATVSGPSGNASYVMSIPDVLRVPSVIGGLPIIWTEHCSTLGSAGDVILADLSYYLLGDRQAVTVESTIAERFQYGQTSFRVTWRGDGQPLMSAPIYLADGSTQTSPFVILGAKTT